MVVFTHFKNKTENFIIMLLWIKKFIKWRYIMNWYKCKKWICLFAHSISLSTRCSRARVPSNNYIYMFSRVLTSKYIYMYTDPCYLMRRARARALCRCSRNKYERKRTRKKMSRNTLASCFSMKKQRKKRNWTVDCFPLPFDLFPCIYIF